MVATTKELQNLEISVESFFLGKWIFEKDYPCIPAKRLHMPKLRSHDKKEVSGNTEEVPLVSSGNPSPVVKRGKRKDAVFDISTTDKRKGRSIERNAKKSEKVSGNTETVYPKVLMRNVPLEFVTQRTKKADVFKTAIVDGQIKDGSRDVKRKIDESEIIESCVEMTGVGLSSTVALRKSQRIQNRKNKNNDKNKLSAQHLGGILTKKCYICLEGLSKSIIKQSLRKENSLGKTIQRKEKKPNKDGQGETGRSSGRFSKKVDYEPKEKSRYGPRYGEVSDCKLEKKDKLVEKENEPSKDGQGRNLTKKAKTKRRYQYFTLVKSSENDRKDIFDDSYDETWVEPTAEKKKIAVTKLENDKRKRSVMEDENKTKTASSQNKRSEQKKMQDENSKQGTNDNVNARKTKVRTKKARTEESKMPKTADEVAATTYSQKKQKEIRKPNDNVNAREKKVRTMKARTENSKKAKTADKLAATTYDQGKEKTNKPEDFVITAQRGTLKYLKQRERLLEAKAKEAEVDDDYFSSFSALKGKKDVLNQLLAPTSNDDSLTITTPKNKGREESDGVITPRTALLGRFGTVTPTSHAVTPCTSSPLPSKSERRDAALEVMFHHMKGARKRPRGITKNHQDNFILSDSMLKTFQAPQLLELPRFLDVSASDSSHDEYFEYSDAI